MILQPIINRAFIGWGLSLTTASKNSCGCTWSMKGYRPGADLLAIVSAGSGGPRMAGFRRGAWMTMFLGGTKNTSPPGHVQIAGDGGENRIARLVWRLFVPWSIATPHWTAGRLRGCVGAARATNGRWGSRRSPLPTQGCIEQRVGRGLRTDSPLADDFSVRRDPRQKSHRASPRPVPRSCSRAHLKPVRGAGGDARLAGSTTIDSVPGLSECALQLETTHAVRGPRLAILQPQIRTHFG